MPLMTHMAVVLVVEVIGLCVVVWVCALVTEHSYKTGVALALLHGEKNVSTCLEEARLPFQICKRGLFSIFPQD